MHSYLNYILSQTPLVQKFLRNVKDVVRRSDKFTIVKNLGGLTLVANNSEELFCKPEFLLEKIITEFNRHNNESDTNSLLNRLYQVLTTQNDYRRSILLTDVVSLFKNILALR